MTIRGKKSDIIISDEMGHIGWMDSPKSNKFAPVAPAGIYKAFLNHGYIPSTVLLLAHDVVANGIEYEETFKDPRWLNTNIIMDNSVVELRKAVDISMVKDAVDIVAADIAVLPDVMNNGRETAGQIVEAWEKWRWTFKDVQLMALIQGSDILDWMYCLEMIDEHAEPDWIGIPRCMERIDGLSRTDYITYAHMVFPNKPIHLFGCSDYPWEDYRAAKSQYVRSIDSAAPLRLRDDFVLSGDPGPRGDWWEKAEFDPQMIENCRRINQLISA